MTLTILRGLPASGKSTRAAELLKTSGNSVRLNRDLLRTMLHCDRWSPRLEGVTKDAERALAKAALAKGLNVVIDDTNLADGTVESWKQLAKECGATVVIETIDTPLAACLARDRSREKRVGDHVIYGMAMQYGRYQEPEEGIVLCDLDGTLANIDHRLHCSEQTPKDWVGFFAGIPNDTLRTDVLDRLLEHERAGRAVFFVSGRPDDYRAVTEAWLKDVLHGDRLHTALFMRRAGDRRPDTVVKEEILTRYFQGRHIVDVLDDRPSVIQMWRAHGLPVTDVGSDRYFREERAALNYWTGDV